MGAIQSLFARVDAGYLVTAALTVFSGVYLTRTGVSPIYGTTVIGVAALMIWYLAARGAAPLTVWAQSLGTLLVAAPIVIHHVVLKGGPGNVVNFVLGPILAALIPMSGRRLDRPQLVSIARTLVLATLAVTTVECVYRLTHPDLGFLEDTSQRDDAEDLAFYAFKFNSLMYIDSNFVGLQLALLLAFLFGLSRLEVRIPRPWFLYTFVLTILTLSRASIFASAFLLCLELYRHFAKGVVLKFLVVGAVVVGVVGAFYVVQNDVSFATKFDILHRFGRYLSRAKLDDLLFGIGVGHAVAALGIGAHNLVVTYVIELGLLVSLAIFAYWLCLAITVPAVGYMVVVWVVNGFSLTTLAVPYMYASAAVLLLLHRLKQRPLPIQVPSAKPLP